MGFNSARYAAPPPFDTLACARRLSLKIFAGIAILYGAVLVISPAQAGPDASNAPDLKDYDAPRPPAGTVQPDAPAPELPAKVPSAEAEDRPLPSKPPSARMGWAATPASLILYGPTGDVSQEIGLKAWDERPGGKIRRHTLRGGCSTDGRFAWSWEKIENFPAGQIEKAAEESRTLEYFGSDGGELWRDVLADAPAGFDPAAVSGTGETLLISERASDAWVAAAVSFAGDRIVESRGKGPIENVVLTRQGKFGLVTWRPIDQPLTYTFFDIEAKKTIPLPMEKIPPMRLTLDEAGKVFAGKKLVFDVQAAHAENPPK